MEKLSSFIDKLSALIAAYKGLLPTIGIMLVIGNLIITLTSSGFMAQSNLLLHIGVVIAILGFMLGLAL